MKTKLFLFIAFLASFALSAQSTINITTSGGSFPTEKWVSITTGVDGSGTQIWGQGNGSYGNGAGLINQDIMIPPGTYWVNCYDSFSDGWDGTLINVTAYGAVIGDNGGVSPSDPTTNDSNGSFELPADELEASFMIVVPMPPSCVLPTTVSSTGVASTTADFSWTDSALEDAGYNWEVVPAGSGQGVGVVASGTTAADAAMVSVTGLSSFTNYDFYIQSNCGGSTSIWSSAVSFSTTAACGDTVYDTGGATGDYSSNENYSITYFPDVAGNVVTLDFISVALETCCDDLAVYDGVDTSAPVLNGDLTAPATFTASNAAGAITIAFDSDGSIQGAGWEALYTCAAPPTCLDSSALMAGTITPTSVELSWTSGGSGESSWELEYGVDGFTQGTAAGTIVPASTNPFTLMGLSANTDYEVYVRAVCSPTDSSEWSPVETFSTPATCITSTALTASNESTMSVDLSWTSGGSGESSWELEYGVDGFTQGTAAGTIVPASTNPFTLMGLSSSTDYDVYVRAVCSPTDSSEWSSVESFSTLCGPVTSYPSDADMSSNVPNSCWSESGSGEIVDGPSGTFSDWRSGRSYTNASNDVIASNAINLFSNVDREWLLTEQFDLSTGNLELVIEVALTDWTSSGISDATDTATMGSDDQVDLLITTDNGVTWTSIDSWNTSNEPSVTGSEYNYDLNSYTGVVQFAFFASDGTSDDGEDYDFHVGKFEIAAPAVNYTWDGSAWDTTPEGNITGNDNMIVQSGTMAVLSSAITAGNVTVEAGASLDASAGDVSIEGTLDNNGTITGSSEVVMEGAGTVSLTGTGTMSNLTVGASTSLTVSGPQSITAQLDVDSGGSLNANGNITLISNAMGTARVDEVDAGVITGDVNVERYIPASNRSFRFLGSSVTGPTVFDSWQEAGANAAGFGIQVTGVVGAVGTNNAATGLDETLTGNPSMFSWNDAGQSWDAITSTSGTILSAGDFYRVFVRGDRMTDLSSNTSAATATTLRATGSLLTGPYSVTPNVASGEFFAVANPYQSKLDMGDVAPTNVATDMYYWDASLGSNGGYTNINIATGTGTAGAATNVLDAGQAVFFASTGSSTVSIDEADKADGTTNAAVFSTPVVNQMLRVKLYQTSRYQNNQTESDGMYIHFDNTFNDAVTSNDAIKWDGLNTNISIQKATGEQLSVERRSLPTVNESVPLHLSNHLATDYTMTVELDMLPGLDVFVKDNLTNTLTPVANSGVTAVNFLVDANNAASIDANRFEIVFQVVTLGLNDEDLLSQVRLYPNPVTGDELQLQLGNLNDGDALSVAIYNTLGQQVRVYNYESNISNTITVGNLDTLSSGVYILNITKGDKTAAHRFIKK